MPGKTQVFNGFPITEWIELRKEMLKAGKEKEQEIKELKRGAKVGAEDVYTAKLSTQIFLNLWRGIHILWREIPSMSIKLGKPFL